ncbi:hypothetical protein, partial [Acinetobacter baumannii]|uniref:hypothetical protein n=1 Tax=Acinetobacter baumannii TaxID=470 RepID=UPI001C07EC29
LPATSKDGCKHTRYLGSGVPSTPAIEMFIDSVNKPFIVSYYLQHSVNPLTAESRYIPVGKIAKKQTWRSAFLLNRRSK